ncbi:MAG: radical SAM protein [Polyangiaceae bacterium]|nr:radical SAM protein [Polyangiaceae bacterium]
MELVFFVDHQCNLRCTYCYTGEKATRTMSVDTMRAGVALALRAPPPHLDVAFFGGEPLLRLELLRATIAHVEAEVAALGPRAPSLRFLLNTNATLVDDEVVALFAPPRVSTAFVSLDGPRHVHDRHRVNAAGRGSFDDVMVGLSRLRAGGVAFQLMVVVTPATAPDLGATLRHALTLGATKIQLNADHSATWDAAALAGLRAGLEAAGEVWADAFRGGQAPRVEPLHTKILGHVKGGVPCPSRCLLGGDELTVTPSGRLYPCPQMVAEDRGGELVLGHVATGVDPARQRALQAQKDEALEICGECDLQARCQSHCGCRHVASSGRLGRITETLCDLEGEWIAAADRVAEAMFAERVPAFLDFYYRKAWAPATGARLIQLRRSSRS